MPAPKCLIDEDGRECYVCKVYKPWSEFYTLKRNGKRGHQSDCKACHRAQVKAADAANPEAVLARARRWRENNPEKYLAIEIRRSARNRGQDEEAMLAHYRDHPGTCDICGGLPGDAGGFFTRLSIDHNHETGEFRGLLCASCNAGVGMFRDDPKIMMLAIQYLKRTMQVAA